jgi:hypothetical protein
MRSWFIANNCTITDQSATALHGKKQGLYVNVKPKFTLRAIHDMADPYRPVLVSFRCHSKRKMLGTTNVVGASGLDSYIADGNSFFNRTWFEIDRLLGGNSVTVFNEFTDRFGKRVLAPQAYPMIQPTTTYTVSQPLSYSVAQPTTSYSMLPTTAYVQQPSLMPTTAYVQQPSLKTRLQRAWNELKSESVPTQQIVTPSPYYTTTAAGGAYVRPTTVVVPPMVPTATTVTRVQPMY